MSQETESRLEINRAARSFISAVYGSVSMEVGGSDNLRPFSPAERAALVTALASATRAIYNDAILHGDQASLARIRLLGTPELTQDSYTKPASTQNEAEPTELAKQDIPTNPQRDLDDWRGTSRPRPYQLYWDD